MHWPFIKRQGLSKVRISDFNLVNFHMKFNKITRKHTTFNIQYPIISDIFRGHKVENRFRTGQPFDAEVARNHIHLAPGVPEDTHL